jgi:hypothetical protein
MLRERLVGVGGVSLAAVVAAMVFLFVGGSSSLETLTSLSHQARWVALVAFWLAGAALAYAARPRLAAVPLFALLVLFVPALGLVSALWSVAPMLTAARAISFAILVSGTLLVASAASVLPDVRIRVLEGIVYGAGLAALGGIILVVTDYGHAVQAAGSESPARFRGLGENPNTLPMLAAAALPIAVWYVATSRSKVRRAIGGCTALLLFGTIIASGSRGGFLAAFGGMLAFALVNAPRRRPAGAAVVLVVFAVGLGLGQLPQPTPAVVAVAPPPAPPSIGVGATKPPPSRVMEYDPGRLEDEVDRPLGGAGTRQRRLLGSSGRVEAWRGGFQQANERPMLGYGFATEEKVFIDRFYTFQGARPENSWVGMYMELGAVGVALLAAIWLTVVAMGVTVVRRLGTTRAYAAAVVGTAAAGLLLTVPQSYLFSVGNVATATVWICLALLTLLAHEAVTGDHADERSWAARVVLSPRWALRLAAVSAVVLLLLIPTGRWQSNRAIAAEQTKIEAIRALAGPLDGPRLDSYRFGRMDCLLYRYQANAFALELCFDGEGRLIEAIDRRNFLGDPRVGTVRYAPNKAPVRYPPAQLMKLFHRLGATGATLVAEKLPLTYPDGGPQISDRSYRRSLRRGG